MRGRAFPLREVGRSNGVGLPYARAGVSYIEPEFGADRPVALCAGGRFETSQDARQPTAGCPMRGRAFRSIQAQRRYFRRLPYARAGVPLCQVPRRLPSVVALCAGGRFAPNGVFQAFPQGCPMRGRAFRGRSAFGVHILRLRYELPSK